MCKDKKTIIYLLVVFMLFLVGISGMYLSIIDHINDVHDDIRVLIKGHYNTVCYQVQYDEATNVFICQMPDYEYLLDTLYE